jgi:hypothetical protein
VRQASGCGAPGGASSVARAGPTQSWGRSPLGHAQPPLRPLIERALCGGCEATLTVSLYWSEFRMLHLAAASAGRGLSDPWRWHSSGHGNRRPAHATCSQPERPRELPGWRRLGLRSGLTHWQGAPTRSQTAAAPTTPRRPFGQGTSPAGQLYTLGSRRPPQCGRAPRVPAAALPGAWRGHGGRAARPAPMMAAAARCCGAPAA